MPRRKQKNAIELFCGAGGTSLGFELSGAYKVALGMDFDPTAMETFSTNHPDAQSVTADICNLPPKDVARTLCGMDIDMLIGGPSCQGYSTIGKRIADDPRNSLYSKYLDYVDEFRPSWLVFENVRGFLHSGKGRFFNEFRGALENLGYDVAAALLNAADYGVPQRRERVIIVATNSGVEPSLPAPTHEDPRCPNCSRPDKSNRIRSETATEDCGVCEGTGLWNSPSKKPWLNLHDAIGDLPWLDDLGGSIEHTAYSSEALSTFQAWARKCSDGYTMHKAKPVSDFALSVIEKIPAGKGIRSIPEEELPERFRIMRTINGGKLRRDCTTLYGRLEWGMPSYTITCYFKNVSSGAFTHPEVHRSITLREAARLQSFPDRYEIVAASAARQIGNAVPPLLAKAVANHIIRLETGARPKSVAADRARVVARTEQMTLFA